MCFKKNMLVVLLFVSVLSITACSKQKGEDTTSIGVESEIEVTKAVEELKDNKEPVEDNKTEELLNDSDKNEDMDETVPVIIEPSVEYVTVYEENFESNTSSFTSRSVESTSIIEGSAKEGTYSLVSSNRGETWHGPKVDLSNTMVSGKRFIISGWLKYEDGDASSLRIYCKLEKNSSEYITIGTVLAKKGEWTYIEGEIQIPNETNTAAVYFETEYKSAYTKDDLVDIHVDDIKVTEVIVEVTNQVLPALKDIYSDYFTMGVAVGANALTSMENVDLIKSQFNSITMGNEMKPDSVLDYEACIANLDVTNEEPALRFNRLDIGLKFAKENGLILRGHTLVWHSQTPSWFFKEAYSKDSNAPLVSKEIMLKRMESYIKQVLQYTNDNYPGVIYAWDVVNEAILTSDGQTDGYRVNDSLWYQTIGSEYIEKAFFYARKYALEDVKLFYNDYNTYEVAKRFAIYDLAKMLQEKGLIDGIGMQSHIKMDYPSLIEYERTIRKFAELNLEIHITELDIDMETNTEEMLSKQAMRYKRLFTMLKKLRDDDSAKITNITFWGLTDDTSWLNDETPSYPLLFDKYNQAKKAFYGVILDKSIPLY